MAREILIANSDKGDQEEFRKIFGPTDYEVVFSESGEDALLRVKLFKPDLVIAGVGLNEKNGLELCEILKKDSESNQIPFILLTGIFEEVTERDRLRVGADGVISKPLQGGEILDLVGQLIEETQENSPAQNNPVQTVKAWNHTPGKSSSGEKEAFVLEGLDEDDEEIIDLVDLVEEPEPKMSIDDFITTGKTEPVSEITPLDTWDKLFVEEEKKAPEEAPVETQELSLSEEEEGVPPADVKDIQELPSKDLLGIREEEAGPQVSLKTEEELPQEDELFEKIELEEILEKVEKLQPSIEKEWPQDEEIEKRILEAFPTPGEDLSGKWVDLNEFEKALKSGVKEEGKAEPEVEAPLAFLDTLEGFTLEKQEEKAFREPSSKAGIPPVQEEPLSFLDTFEDFSLEKSEEKPLREPFTGAAEAPVPEAMPSFLDTHETLKTEEPKEEAFHKPLLQAVEVAVEEEPPAELAGEELPLGLLEEELDESQIRFVEKIIEGVEETPLLEKEEKAEVFPLGTPPLHLETVPAADLSRELEISSLMQEAPAPSIQPDQVQAPKTSLEEIHPPRPQYDQQLGEMIGKGVQEMMEGFIMKVLPEMTQNILNLTMERIEKMVREVVPDLAEKAVREEIERLQKGEKG